MKQATSRIRKVFRDPVTGEKSHVWADKITCRYDDIEKGPIVIGNFASPDFGKVKSPKAKG